MRAVKGIVVGALALGGMLIAQSDAQARPLSAPALTPIASEGQGQEIACSSWGHRVWHGRGYGYGWHRHYGWHPPYGFYRPHYHYWYRPYGYGWHRPWGWHHHYGWHRW